jgi:hypothetical protein
MRTLFLLGILATLAIIAVKKPNQTAWDAAQELSGKARTVISNAEAPVAKVIPFEPFIKKALEDEAKIPASPEFPAKEKASPKVSGISNTPKLLHKTKPSKKQIAKAPINDWSKLPAIPVAPRPIHTANPPASAEASKPISTPGADYADVKIYYENASRLLDEIK